MSRKGLVNEGRVAKVLVFVLVAMVCMGMQVDAGSGSYYGELSGYVDMYNQSIDNVPGYVKTMVRNETIVLVLSKSGPDEVIGVVTDGDARVVRYSEQGPARPSMRIVVSEGTVERLMRENSAQAVLAAIGEDIKVEGIGFRSRFKVFVLRMVGSFARMLS